MKKDNRQLYLDTWREYLKGKNLIDPKALSEFFKDKLGKDFSETTLKRYTATVIANLYENGFLGGKKGKTFSGEPLELVREITPYVLDQALTQNYRKVKFSDLGKPAEMVKTLPKAPKGGKPKKAVGKKKSTKAEVVTEIAPKKPGRKPAKPKTDKVAKPGPKKMAAAKAEKPARRKPVPKKKVAEKTTMPVAATVNKKPGRKPGRKPKKKAAAMVPVAKGRKMASRRADVIKKGQQALEFFLDQQRQIDEMAFALANYERVFAAVRGLFSREMEEIEELVGGLLEQTE
jgi:hypothetical protein